MIKGRVFEYHRVLGSLFPSFLSLSLCSVFLNGCLVSVQNNSFSKNKMLTLAVVQLSTSQAKYQNNVSPRTSASRRMLLQQLFSTKSPHLDGSISDPLKRIFLHFRQFLFSSGQTKGNEATQFFTARNTIQTMGHFSAGT